MTGLNVAVSYTRVSPDRLPTANRLPSGLKRASDWIRGYLRARTRRRVRRSHASTEPPSSPAFASTTMTCRPSGLSARLRISRSTTSGSPMERPLGSARSPTRIGLPPMLWRVASSLPSALTPGVVGTKSSWVVAVLGDANGATGVGVDERDELVESQHDREPAAGYEADAEHVATIRDDGERPALIRPSEIHDADRTALVAEGQPPAVGAERGDRPVGRPGVDRPAEPPRAR